MDRKDKQTVYKTFIDGNLEVKSVSKDLRVEWKRIVDVTRHDVSSKQQFKILTDKGQGCAATGDHSLFQLQSGLLREWKTGEFSVGSTIVCVDGDAVLQNRIISNLLIPSMKYMYDLTVEDNQNFVLDSGILAHNTFRPPESSKFVQGQTQVFGFIWEDEELLEYLYMAVDDFNSRPPTTGIDFTALWGSERRWRTAVIIRAAAFACFAIAMSWISNEFTYSISGVSLDLEKSSKYQSMKDEYIAEYDKLVEAAKRSIKIIKWLRQMR